MRSLLPLPRGARSLSAAALLTLLSVSICAAEKAPAVYKPKLPGRQSPKPVEYVPDSTVLARVGDRAIRASDYIDRYFASAFEFRPKADSAGRREFLDLLIEKEVLAAVARQVGRKETFDERAILKTHEQRVLGNILFQRVINDSIHVTEEQALAVYAQYKRNLHFNRVRFGSQATAERMRRELQSKRLSWARAWDLRLRVPGDTVRSADIGWKNRTEVPSHLVSELFSLPVGGVSSPIPEPPGFSLYGVVEERPYPAQGFETYRGSIVDELSRDEAARRRERLMAGLRKEIGMRVDSAQVVWLTTRFPEKFTGGGSSSVVINVSVPELVPEDTSRVVATYDGGRVTAGRVLDDYRSMDAMMRPDLSSEEGVRGYLDLLVLEPRLAEIARKRGLDKDPATAREIALRREGIMVEHLFEDSVEAKVFVPPAARRKYYKENEHRFVTDATCEYALFYVDSKRTADSLATQLRRGVSARAILHADSLAGLSRGRIETQSLSQTGAMFHNRLFQELKDGEAFVHGPNEAGAYNVVQLIHRESGRQVSFEEADAQIDEYLRQVATDEQFALFTARHKAGMRIESYPELLMRVRLVDPTLQH